MSTLFPTITGSHWALAIRRGRAEGNLMLQQIRARCAPLTSRIEYYRAGESTFHAVPVPAHRESDSRAPLQRLADQLPKSEAREGAQLPDYLPESDSRGGAENIVTVAGSAAPTKETARTRAEAGGGVTLSRATEENAGPATHKSAAVAYQDTPARPVLETTSIGSPLGATPAKQQSEATGLRSAARLSTAEFTRQSSVTASGQCPPIDHLPAEGIPLGVVSGLRAGVEVASARQSATPSLSPIATQSTTPGEPRANTADACPVAVAGSCNFNPST